MVDFYHAAEQLKSELARCLPWGGRYEGTAHYEKLRHDCGGSDDSRQYGAVSLQAGGLMDQFQSYTLANDAFDEFAYPAALAEQSCSLYRHCRGITARFSGWSDKQDRLPKRWLRRRAVSLSVNGASRCPERGNVAHWDVSSPGRGGRRRPWAGRANHTERIP